MSDAKVFVYHRGFRASLGQRGDSLAGGSGGGSLPFFGLDAFEHAGNPPAPLVGAHGCEI
eukprot:4575933-Karenia_brevis.AAC.1